MIELQLQRGFVSMTVAAGLLGLTRQRMHQLLKAGRIPGAFLMECGDGRERWVVPRNEIQLTKRRKYAKTVKPVGVRPVST